MQSAQRAACRISKRSGARAWGKDSGCRQRRRIRRQYDCSNGHTHVGRIGRRRRPGPQPGRIHRAGLFTNAHRISCGPYKEIGEQIRRGKSGKFFGSGVSPPPLFPPPPPPPPPPHAAPPPPPPPPYHLSPPRSPPRATSLTSDTTP